MSEPEQLEPGPPIEDLAPVFQVYETRREDDRLIYYGEPLAPQDTVLRRVWPLFRDRGYEVQLARQTGEHVLVAEPVEPAGVNGIPWTNVLLFVATLLSTIWAGTMWYYVRDPLSNPIVAITEAWPFAAAVLGVLGVHELGHYVMSRYHNVRASLPYFIPLPLSFIGTMGAVIRMRGQMPNRKALFDIGVAGPLAGLVATVVVTVIGLLLPPIEVPQWVLESSNTTQIQFGYPLLFQWIALALGEDLAATGDPTTVTNPVVFGGWIGMFVTFLNLLPVGQLDGGHITRALFGERQPTIAAAVPGALFALAGYLIYFRDVGPAVGIWLFWGLIAVVLAYSGPARPVNEESLGWPRKLVGVLTLALGVLCFTPVPFQLMIG